MKINVSKRSRVKLTWFAAISISLLSAYSIVENMDAVALAGVASLTLIIERYLARESEKPSVKRDE